MTAKQKRDIIDAMNEAFQEEVKNNQMRKYKRKFRKLVNDILTQRPTTRRQLVALIRKHQINIRDHVLMFTVLNTVTSIIASRPTGTDRQLTAGMETIMGQFNILKPKKFARSIWNMIKGNKKQTKKEQRFRPILLSYYDNFTENIESTEQQMERTLLRGRLETVNDLFADMEALREQRLSAAEIKKQLLAKYNDPYRINRALDTELHEQAERTKMEQSKFMGYKYKQWNTQNDERVRRTRFHDQAAKKRVPIDQAWTVGNITADYPGDIRLPAGERIFCRCYVTYHNGPTGA